MNLRRRQRSLRHRYHILLSKDANRTLTIFRVLGWFPFRHRGYPQSSIPVGFSMKSTIQLLGYPHDSGNLLICAPSCSSYAPFEQVARISCRSFGFLDCHQRRLKPVPPMPHLDPSVIRQHFNSFCGAHCKLTNSLHKNSPSSLPKSWPR